MNLRELSALVSGGESAQIEFKKTTGQRSDGAKTVSAMLNGGGGYVFFGVDDAGRLCGMGMPGYPQCLLRMARFRGVDKTEFVDSRHEVGNAFELLHRAQRFLRDHLPVAGRIVPGLFTREDDPMYPPVALREALVNAFCHRDYGMPGGSVGIAIYDDRLEITSTGRLPFGLTPADLRRPHTSLPWNPLIASVFMRRGVAENWGRGTMKIVELSAAAGLVEPEFEERGGEVVVRFLPLGYVPPSRVNRETSAFERELLEIIAELGSARLGEIEARLQQPVPRFQVQEALKSLRVLGLIEASGYARGARWKLRS